MNFMDTIGLGAFSANENIFERLMKYVCEKGRVFRGYQGFYIYQDIGQAEHIAHLLPDGEVNHFVGYSTHVMGNYFWNLQIAEEGVLKEEDEDSLSKCVYFKKNADADKYIPIRLVHADVLPCFSPGETVSMQVTAFPVNIHYYEDEEHCELDKKMKFMGKPLRIASGNFMYLQPDSDVCFIKGIVKDVDVFYSYSPEGEVKFFRVVIETEFGDMQLCHSGEMVDETERCYIKKGACLTTDCVISADVAVGKYQNGAIYDEISLLKLLKEGIDNNDFSRVINVFTEDATYTRAGGEIVESGRQRVLDRFKEVIASNDGKCYTYIFKVSDYMGENEENKKREGNFCLGISYETPAHIGTVLFLELNEDKKIVNLYNPMEVNYDMKIVDNNSGGYDENFELCLLKDGIDERNIMKCMNIFDRNAEFVLGDELLSKVIFNTFMYFERFFTSIAENNLDVNTYIVKIVGRYDQIGDEHIGKKAIALSVGDIDISDGLYIVDRNEKGLISRITSIGATEYIIEDITPKERYASPKLIYDKNTFALPVDERERLDFVIQWLNSIEDFESDFKFYKALDKDCKLILDVACRVSESFGNEEVITTLRILANRYCETKDIYIEDGHIVVVADTFGCYVYISWNESGLISEIKIVDFK